MRRIGFSACWMSLTLCMLVLCTPRPRTTALDEDDRRLIAWFDGLGYPALAHRKFGRLLRPGETLEAQAGGITFLGPPIFGFLLAKRGEEFTVLTLDLAVDSFGPPGPDELSFGPPKFLEMDLKRTAREVLYRFWHPTLDDAASWSRFGETTTERVESFVLARACAANGFDQLAHDLIQQAATALDRTTGKTPGLAGLAKTLSEELAYTTMWRNVVDLGDPAVSRSELLKRFRDLARRFPDSSHAARARETAEILERMVHEDEEHARRPPKAWDDMTLEEQVAELIFQLRDQNGRQMSQPGSCDIFADPRDWGEYGPFGRSPGAKLPHGGSPASRLLALGFDAVPQLTEHVGDPRLTRSIGYHRHFYFSHHALSVGECARKIIEKITDWHLPRDEQPAEIQRRARKWWNELQAKGERQLLVETTRAGSDQSPRQAKRLLERYPDAALAALIAGANNTGNPRVRAELLEVAGRIEGDESTQFLRGQLQRDWDDLPVRVAAARALLAREPAEAVSALIREWTRIREHPPQSLAQGWYVDDDIKALIRALADADDASAIRAMADGLEKQAVVLPLAVISVFGSYTNFSTASSSSTCGFNWPDHNLRLSRTALAAVEELLVTSLDDTRQVYSCSGDWKGRSFVDPRLCDIAATILADRWRGKYAFDVGASVAVRDRRRVSSMNLWRGEHALPPLP